MSNLMDLLHYMGMEKGMSPVTLGSSPKVTVHIGAVHRQFDRATTEVLLWQHPYSTLNCSLMPSLNSSLTQML